jgi:hypothetical protein
MKVTLKQIKKRIPFISDLIRNLSFEQNLYLLGFILRNFLISRLYQKSVRPESDIISDTDSTDEVEVVKLDSIKVYHSKRMNQVEDLKSQEILETHYLEDSDLKVHKLANSKLIGLDLIPTFKNSYYAEYRGRTKSRQQAWVDNFSGSPFVLGKKHLRNITLDDGNYVCIRNHTNYYQYVTEELIKLYYANCIYDEFSVINNLPYLNYHQDFNTMIDYDIINHHDGVIVPNLLEVNTLDHSKEAFEFVKQYFVERAATFDIDFPEYDYIFSVRSGTRKISNLSEIKSAFSDAGVDILFVDFAKSNTIRDIIIISQCKGFIGGHGAGMTNLIWGSDLDVLEIGTLHNTSSFLLLSNLMGHNYEFFKAEKVSPGNSDVNVPVEKLLDFAEGHLFSNSVI